MAGSSFFVCWSFAFNLSFLTRELYVSSKVGRWQSEIKTMRGGAVSVGMASVLAAVLLATVEETKIKRGLATVGIIFRDVLGGQISIRW